MEPVVTLTVPMNSRFKEAAVFELSGLALLLLGVLAMILPLAVAGLLKLKRLATSGLHPCNDAIKLRRAF